MLHFVAGVDQSVTISSELRPVSAEIFFMYCQASITDKAADVRLGEVKSRTQLFALCMNTRGLTRCRSLSAVPTNEDNWNGVCLSVTWQTPPSPWARDISSLINCKRVTLQKNPSFSGSSGCGECMRVYQTLLRPVGRPTSSLYPRNSGEVQRMSFTTLQMLVGYSLNPFHGILLILPQNHQWKRLCPAVTSERCWTDLRFWLKVKIGLMSKSSVSWMSASNIRQMLNIGHL